MLDAYDDCLDNSDELQNCNKWTFVNINFFYFVDLDV
jgi:hypothetical protein